MENNSEKAVKSGAWYVVSNVLLRAMGIITAPLYTRLLTTSESGYANNFNNYVSLITVVTCLCLIYSVGRAKLDFKDDFDGYMSSIQALSSGFALIVLILAMILTPPEGIFGYNKLTVFILFAYLVVFTIATIILSVLFIYMLPQDKGFGKILGTVIPSAAVALWCYFNLLRKGKTLYKKEYWIYALRIGLPMIPHGLAMIILARIDTSMISNMCSFSDVGLYTWGYTIGTLLMFITNAVGQAWLPWFNERLHAGDRELIKEKNMLLMKAGCFLTLMFIAATPEAVKILLAKPYWECMWVVPPVALGTLCQYFYTNYVNQELYHKKTVMIAVNSIIAALINTGLNYIFIQRYGYIAAAYTTLAGYFILMCLHYISTKIILKEKLYRDGAYFFMLLVTVAAGLLFMMLYDRILLRYLIIIPAFAVLVFIYKDVIIKIIEKFR